MRVKLKFGYDNKRLLFEKDMEIIPVLGQDVYLSKDEINNAFILRKEIPSNEITLGKMYTVEQLAFYPGYVEIWLTWPTLFYIRFLQEKTIDVHIRPLYAQILNHSVFFTNKELKEMTWGRPDKEIKKLKPGMFYKITRKEVSFCDNSWKCIFYAVCETNNTTKL